MLVVTHVIMTIYHARWEWSMELFHWLVVEVCDGLFSGPEENPYSVTQSKQTGRATSFGRRDLKGEIDGAPLKRSPPGALNFARRDRTSHFNPNTFVGRVYQSATSWCLACKFHVAVSLPARHVNFM